MNKKHKKSLMIATAIASIAVPASTVISCTIGTVKPPGPKPNPKPRLPLDVLTDATSLPVDEELNSSNYEKNTLWDNSPDPITHQPKGELTIRDGVREIDARVFQNGYPNPNNPSQFLPIKILHLSNTLVSIDDSAFEGVQILSLDIPETLNIIGNKAFLSAKLESLDIPDSVTSIGRSAFEESLIQTLIIPNSVTYIGDNAFAASPFTYLEIPKYITNENVGANAFASTINQHTTTVIMKFDTDAIKTKFFGNDWNNITFFSGILNESNYQQFSHYEPSTKTLTIEGEVIEITDVFGEGYPNLEDPENPLPITSVNLPPTLKIIGDNAFQAAKLTSLTLPDSVQTIGSYSFHESILTSLTIPNNVKSIDNNAFEKSQLTSLTIPNSVTDIGASVFAESPLTSLTFGNSLLSIKYRAFYSAKLTSLTIPDGVTSIQQGAFNHSPLTSLTIPDSVTDIGQYVFWFIHNDQNTYITMPAPFNTDEAKNRIFGPGNWDSIHFDWR